MRAYKTTTAAGLLFISMAFFSIAHADDYYCPSEYSDDYDYETVYGNIIVKEGDECMLTGTTVYGNVLLYKYSSLTASDVYIEGNVEAYMAKYVRLSRSGEDCMDGQECMTSEECMASWEYIAREECMTSTVVGDIKIEFAPEYMPDDGMMSGDWESYIKHTMVDGNIQLYENWNPITLFGNYVTGDIQASYNWGDLLIEMNAVEGNIQVENNYGAVDIANNYYVTGDIQAFYNWGGVTIESNKIYGNLQCKGNDPMPYGGENWVDGNKEDQCEYLSPKPDSGGQMTGSATGSGAVPSSSAAATSADSGGGAAGPIFGITLLIVALLWPRRRPGVVTS